jgi:Fe-S cluster assembly protein SufD
MSELVPVPTRSQEAWRYVDVTLLADHAKTSAFSKWTGDLPLLPLPDAPTLVLLNGEIQDALSSKITELSQVSLIEFSELSEIERSSVLTWRQDVKADYFAARHDDENDIFLRISGEISEAFQICSLHTGDGAESRSRVHLLLEESSQASVVLVSAGSDEAYLANVEWGIHQQASSQLKVQICQQDGPNSLYAGGVFARCGASSHLEVQSSPTPSRCLRQRLRADILGESTHVGLSGVGVLEGQESLHHHIVINHLVGNCTSSQHFKTVLRDKTRSSFDGTIEVFRGADGTDATQLNRFLMLSDEARASAKPQLKIYADDVSCAHGATLGELEEEERFYLQSRGLNTETSEALLSRGFIEEVLAESPLPLALENWKASVFYPRYSIGE